MFPILICVLLLVGGSMMAVNGNQSASVPVTYAVIETVSADAPVIEIAVPPVPEKISKVAIADGCPGGVCPIRKSVQRVVTTTATVTAEREGVAKRPLRAVASAGSRVLGAVRTILGHERRQARREERRG